MKQTRELSPWLSDIVSLAMANQLKNEANPNIVSLASRHRFPRNALPTELYEANPNIVTLAFGHRLVDGGLATDL